MRKLTKLAVVAAMLLTPALAQAAIMTIDFDSLPGMGNSPGAAVPVANQLSGGFLGLGVSFSSEANYVAVVVHGAPTVSMPNIIGGVTATGNLSYGTPITISFFDPSNSSMMGVTDFFSIRGDQAPGPGTATAQAFDINGVSLGSVTASDIAAGLTLSFSMPGIHRVLLTETSATIGFDNLMFETPIGVLKPIGVPEPITLSLLGAGLLGLGAIRRRRG